MNESMTDQEIKEIEALAEAATQGEWEAANKSVRVSGTQQTYPWGHEAPTGHQGGICNCLGGGGLCKQKSDPTNIQATKNAAFIAASRTAVPRMAQEIRRAWEENAVLKSACAEIESTAGIISTYLDWNRERAERISKNYETIIRAYDAEKAENASLREELEAARTTISTLESDKANLTMNLERVKAELEAAKRDLALIPTICYGDCTGDPSVGVPNCPFYEGPYTHWEAGLPIASGCRFAPKDAENGGANEKG